MYGEHAFDEDNTMAIVATLIIGGPFPGGDRRTRAVMLLPWSKTPDLPGRATRKY